MGELLRCHEKDANRRGYDSKNDYNKNQPLGEEYFSMIFTGLSRGGSCGSRRGKGRSTDGCRIFGGKRCVAAACGSSFALGDGCEKNLLFHGERVLFAVTFNRFFLRRYDHGPYL